MTEIGKAADCRTAREAEAIIVMLCCHPQTRLVLTRDAKSPQPEMKRQHTFHPIDETDNLSLDIHKNIG